MPRLLLLALALALACSHSASSRAPGCDLEAAAAVPAGVEVRWSVAGEQKPRETADQCFLRSFRPPSGFRVLSGEWLAQFAVLADGRLAGFHLLPEEPPELACAVWQTLTRCGWTPGRDIAGRPTAFWVKLPMRLRTERPSGK